MAQISRGNQFLISSCTQRLIELQWQLNQKHLQQEFLSSGTLKDQTLRKLLSEQDLLISYLKQEIRDLQPARVHFRQLQSLIIALQQKYLCLGQSKSEHLSQNQVQLNLLKNQYKQQLELLNKLANQSTTKYELVLRLRERNQMTQALTLQKTEQHQAISQEHKVISGIHKAYKTEFDKIKQQFDKVQSQNRQLAARYSSEKSSFSSNQQKFLDLQNEISRLQHERLKHIEIQKAAQKDNKLLKQQLQAKTAQIKLRQKKLAEINSIKQNLLKDKHIRNEKLNTLKMQNQKIKENLNTQLSQAELKKQRNQQLQEERQLHEVQMQKIYRKIVDLQNQRQEKLKQCFDKQEHIQNSIYYIDQYVLLNNELIKQIEILIAEEIHKLKISGNASRQRSQFVLKLKNFLATTNSGMLRIQAEVKQLCDEFESYKIE